MCCDVMAFVGFAFLSQRVRKLHLGEAFEGTHAAGFAIKDEVVEGSLGRKACVTTVVVM